MMDRWNRGIDTRWMDRKADEWARQTGRLTDGQTGRLIEGLMDR